MTAVLAVAVAAVLLSLVMAGAWLAQRFTGNAGWADAYWSLGLGVAGTGLALTPVAGMEWPTTRQTVVAFAVALWSIRLGAHITARSLSSKQEDPRYAQLRRDWGADFQRRLFLFLQTQAGAGLVLALSIMAAAQNPVPHLRGQDWLAVAILVAAVAGEGLADRQLRRFTADARNKGKVCDTGLWRWSRHPNYFFEWLAWLAYPLFAIDAGGGYHWGYAALIGPVFMYWLLVHVSGIPLLEDHMLRSRGSAYRAYQRRVPAFFPRIPLNRG